MWPFKKRKSKADLAIEWMPRAIEVAEQKWLEFESQPFAANIGLSEKVLRFSEGLSAGLGQWDAFKKAPESVFLLIAAKGIEKSRTHLRMELEAALGIPIPMPHLRTDDEELDELKGKLIDRAERKWTFFQKSLDFKEDVSLGQQIAMFRKPFVGGIRNDFAMFSQATDNEFDATIALGIERSGSHSLVEVHSALGGKF